MTLYAFVLVLLSVFLHAGWNFISKRSVPSVAFYALSSGTAALFWLPFFLLDGDFRLADMPVDFWIFLGGSVFFEVIYVCGLAYSYRVGDISLVYPLARALPLLFTAAVAFVFGLGTRTPGPLALAGMGVVFFGGLLMPLRSARDFRWATYRHPTLFFVLLAAIGTTGYTVMDSQAMAVVKDVYGKKSLSLAICYLFFIEAGLCLGTLALMLRESCERAEFRRLFLRSPYPIYTGIFSSLAYVLILLSMNYITNVSYLQAFRQLSLPIGIFAGIVILKEPHGRLKMVGCALVFAGLVIIALFP